MANLNALKWFNGWHLFNEVYFVYEMGGLSPAPEVSGFATLQGRGGSIDASRQKGRDRFAGFGVGFSYPGMEYGVMNYRSQIVY